MSKPTVEEQDRIWNEHAEYSFHRKELMVASTIDTLNKAGYYITKAIVPDLSDAHLAHPNSIENPLNPDSYHLKDCPFCSSNAVMSGLFPNGQYYVRCSQCRASMYYDRMDKSTAHWNQRCLPDLSDEYNEIVSARQKWVELEENISEAFCLGKILLYESMRDKGYIKLNNIKE